MTNQSFKRELLPDGIHSWTEHNTGLAVHWAVIDRNLAVVNELRGLIPLSNPQWQDLLLLAYELARKKFPAKRDQMVQDYQRSYRR